MMASQEGDVQTNLRSEECTDCSWRLRSDDLPKGVSCEQPAAEQSRGLVWMLVTCTLNNAVVLKLALDIQFGQVHLLPMDHDFRICSKLWSCTTDSCVCTGEMAIGVLILRLILWLIGAEGFVFVVNTPAAGGLQDAQLARSEKKLTPIGRWDWAESC